MDLLDLISTPQDHCPPALGMPIIQLSLLTPVSTCTAQRTASPGLKPVKMMMICNSIVVKLADFVTVSNKFRIANRVLMNIHSAWQGQCSGDILISKLSVSCCNFVNKVTTNRKLLEIFHKCFIVHINQLNLIQGLPRIVHKF